MSFGDGHDVNPPDDAESSSLKPEDYERLFLFRGPWLLGAFLVMFGLIVLLLFWFQVNMRERAGRKIAEARNLLQQADTLPRSPTPRTLDIQEMIVNTQDEREWILQELNRDSFPRHFRDRLKQRYLDATARYRAPSDWRSRLPEDLRRWADRQKSRRRRALRGFLERLPRVLSRNLRRMDRSETLARRLKHDRSAGGAWRRFENARRQLRREIHQVRDLLADTPRLGKVPQLPRRLFQQINDLPDPMTRVSLHYRRLAALTSAPAALVYAERMLRDAERIDPDNPRIHYYLGRTYWRMGLKVLGSEQYLRALRADPDFGQRDRLLSLFRRRVKARPDVARRQYDLGFALHVTGHHEAARRHLRKVLTLLRGQSSMVKVLARKRLRYLRDGIPAYSKLPNF